MSDITPEEFQEFMESEAGRVVEISRERFATELDYSVESIHRLDAVMDEFREKGVAGSQYFEQIILGFAAYFGEVIRRNHPGVVWMKDHPGIGRNVMALSLDGTRDCIFPIWMCRKRLTSADEDRLWSKYDMIILDPFPTAPPPPSRQGPPPLPGQGPPPLPR